MKKIFLISLVALMCSATAWSTTHTVNTDEALRNAFATASSGDVIKLAANVELSEGIIMNFDPSATPKKLILDINGKELSTKPEWYLTQGDHKTSFTFTLYGGSLVVKNSVPGVGGIYNESTGGENSSYISVFTVYGTYFKNCNPRTAAINDLHTYLCIESGVNIVSSKGMGVLIDVFDKTTKNGITNKGTYIYANRGVANGVRIDMKGTISTKGYCMKANGLLGYPDPELTQGGYNDTRYEKYGVYFDRIDSKFSSTLKVKEYFYGEGTTETIQVSDTSYVPYIHVFPSAVINHADAKAGIYSSGYARWFIEGKVSGKAGLYAKSGKIVIKDAIIESTTTGEAKLKYTNTSTGGIDCVGHAVVLESNPFYAGKTEVLITGDSKLSTKATGGAAFIEGLPLNEVSRIESIVINGGSFTGDYAIIISTGTAEKFVTTVSGVVIAGETEVGEEEGAAAINAIIDSNNSHTTTVVVDGKTTVIVSDGKDKPAEVTNWNGTNPQDVEQLSSGSDVNWTGTTPGVVGDGSTETTTTLGELQIVSGTDANPQQLTITENATLSVERLIMNDNASIIVEPGAQLIVTGSQGINAPDESNIIIQSSEEKQATFLFSPDVTSNRHPTATYIFTSKAYKDGAKEVYQRFGVPTFNGETHMTSQNADSYNSYICKWDFDNDQWGAWQLANDIDITGTLPFQGYILGSKNPKNVTMQYTFTGDLMGNMNGNLHFHYGWNYYANSYTAPISIKDFINTVLSTTGSGINATIYLYTDMGDDTYTWIAVNRATAGQSKGMIPNPNGEGMIEDFYPSDIKPMQAFLMLLSSESEVDQVIDYRDNVYNPAMGLSTPAPARAMQADSRMNLTVYNNAAFDNLTLVESDAYTSDYENGYDAIVCEKNTGLALYAMSNDQQLKTLATDNLLGTFIGVDAPQAGTYNLCFSGVTAQDYAIVDMQTNTITEITNGTTLAFTTEEGRNDYRFQIVGANRVPTAIENTDAQINGTGIYSVTGVYLGTNLEALPAGMYIVNGVKVIK